MNKINKKTQHSPLEGSRGISQAKVKDPIGKGPPWTCEIGIILILKVDLDLIVPTETIQ